MTLPPGHVFAGLPAGDPETFLGGRIALIGGDCIDVLAQLEENSIDACVTDPPYALVSISKRFGKPGSAPAKSDGPTGVYARASRGFMSVQWDTEKTAFAPEFWEQVIMRAVLIEREPEYCADLRRRMALILAGPGERTRESFKANGRAQGHDDLPLFGGGMESM